MTNLYNLLGKVVRPGEIPPELDLPFYRLVHDDLAHMDDETLGLHYRSYGRDEGRLASPAAHRAGLTALVPRDSRILEIGPFTKPVFRGPDVAYFDVLDREGLVARARDHGMPTENCPEIDYVSATGDLSVVDAQFPSVFSSHCIEHQPDLVAHLAAVERILLPGGRYFMMIPDKRYCFDALLRESNYTDVLAAHRERRKVHTYANVHAHIALTTHNDAVRHWNGDHADPHADQLKERTARARREFDAAGGGYVDVHAWQFTPSGLREIIAQLSVRDLTGFRIERIYDTHFGNVEFAAILRKPGTVA